MVPTTYPVQFAVDYPDRPLDRVTTIFRLIVAIPILIVLGFVSGGTAQSTNDRTRAAVVVGAGGVIFIAALLMIVFRQKYPRWWFDWNLELLRFMARVGVYLALMDDRYPSTDEQQAVHLDFPYPDAQRDLNRWLPLIKWLLAFPHYIVLIVLYLGAIGAVIIAWFVIIYTQRYPRELFTFVEGVMRWHNRVIGFAVILVTDEYPPFRLAA